MKTYTIRMEPELWDKLGIAVKLVGRELDRSTLFREFGKWYVHEQDDFPDLPSELKLANALRQTAKQAEQDDDG